VAEADPPTCNLPDLSEDDVSALLILLADPIFLRMNQLLDVPEVASLDAGPE
jgi:hypothetical protein